MKIQIFTFGPFQENTYIVYNSTKEAYVIDPGMSNDREQEEFDTFITSNGLNLTKILLTHGHIDHVLGNAFVAKKYGVEIWGHKLAQQTIDLSEMAANMYGIPYEKSPNIKHFIDEGDIITLGEEKLELLFTPGHAPGHVVFIHHAEKWVINGDVLFRGSIGRSDLPGCNPKDLVLSILEKMYKLPDDYTIYSGHGPETTIGYEKKNNGFVKGDSTLESVL